MRGVSNIISALFVIVVILISAHLLTTAYLEYSSGITDAAKKSLERKVYTSNVAYSTAECNAESQRITLKYTGTNPEYSVRFICYNTENPANSLCVVPLVPNNKLSLKYVSHDFSEEIELNVAACEELNNGCENIKCVAVGTYALREIVIVGS